MFSDYPLFGIGLGAWPELFPHYQEAPWSILLMRSAHNDYVQLLAETGSVGFGLLLGASLLTTTTLIRGFANCDRLKVPVVGALLGGLVAMAVHECFDFSFRIPSNALLFCVLAGLVVRMTGSRKSLTANTVRFVRRRDLLCLCVATLALALTVLALRQHVMTDPSGITGAKSILAMESTVLEHPTSAEAHSALASSLSDANARLREMATAVWLEPTNPYARDIYGGHLILEHKEVEGLRQIELSIFKSPDWSTHSYLDEKIVPLFTLSEEAAVERGFRRAVKANYAGAVRGLGRLYDVEGQFLKEAQIYSAEADRTAKPAEREDYLILAGQAYVRGGARPLAESVFRKSVQDFPSGLRGYQALVNLIYSPDHNLASARALTDRGIESGADPAELCLTLAAFAEQIGERRLADQSVNRALSYQPSFKVMLEAGDIYLQNGEFDKAVQTLLNATQQNPVSAQAYYRLGVAEEKIYQYSAADQAYRRAADLEPDLFRGNYRDFQRRISNSSASN
jgi:tetratricopeptide (TPR) repeat protein